MNIASIIFVAGGPLHLSGANPPYPFVGAVRSAGALEGCAPAETGRQP